MIDLDAIRARCEALDRLRAAHPDTTWTACIPNPVMALDDRRELLDEVEQLRDSITSWEMKWSIMHSERDAALAEARWLCAVDKRQLISDTQFNLLLYNTVATERDELGIEVERLRTHLQTILGEVETDFDRDAILTECRSALGVNHD